MVPSTAGRSRTLTLMLAKMMDPMCRATVLPVMALLRAVWEGWLPRHVIDFGMMQCGASSWPQVRGPFSAVHMTLERIGWTIIDAATWRTHEGELLQVFEVSPWLVKRLLWRAVEAWQWQQVAKKPELAHLRDGGVLEPLVRMTSTGAVSRKGVFGDH
eukprot:7005017-Pyramimonas_sp.AAC.1